MFEIGVLVTSSITVVKEKSSGFAILCHKANIE